MSEDTDIYCFECETCGGAGELSGECSECGIKPETLKKIDARVAELVKQKKEQKRDLVADLEIIKGVKGQNYRVLVKEEHGPFKTNEIAENFVYTAIMGFEEALNRAVAAETLNEEFIKHHELMYMRQLHLRQALATIARWHLPGIDQNLLGDAIACCGNYARRLVTEALSSDAGKPILDQMEQLKAEVVSLKGIIRDLLCWMEPYGQKDVDSYDEARCSECPEECKQSDDRCTAPKNMIKFNEAIDAANGAIEGTLGIEESDVLTKNKWLSAENMSLQTEIKTLRKQVKLYEDMLIKEGLIEEGTMPF